MKILKLLKQYFKLKREPLNQVGIRAFKKNYNKLTHQQKGMLKNEIEKKIEEYAKETRTRHLSST